MSSLKKTAISLTLGVTALTGTAAVDQAVIDSQIRSLPAAHVLKAPIERIDVAIDDVDTSYVYTRDRDDRAVLVSSSTSPVKRYAYRTDTVVPKVDDAEILDMRTARTITRLESVDADGTRHLSTESGYLMYRDEADGRWKEYKIATTTPQAYDIQARKSILERAGHWLVETVRAGDTGTTAAGSGSSIDQSIMWGPGVAWSNPGNVTASDNAYATAAVASASQYSCGGSTVNGQYASVMLSGAAVGTAKFSNVCFTGSDTNYNFGGAADVWGTSLTASDVNNSTFGVATLGWNSKGADYGTSKWITGHNFGFAISASSIDGIYATFEIKADGNTGNMYVDYITARVYYTASGGGGGATPAQDVIWFD